MHFRHHLIFYFFILFPAWIPAQELLPFVENFTKTDYHGDNQVWSVVQGNDNAMYFANNHYFLRYNGVKWERYSLPNKTIIRSIFADGDRIYCGSYKEFGFWKRVNGNMVYTSLTKDSNLFIGNADNEEIWKIFKYNNKLYFQSFNEIYIFDGSTIERNRFPSQISYCYQINNKLYAASVRNGIYEVKGQEFVPQLNWPQLRENIVHWMESDGHNIYIFTKNNGIYIDKNGTLKQWEHPLNNKLKSEIIVTAKFLDNNTMLIGTALQGLYMVNLTDDTYKNLNRTNSIKNNAILSVTIDNERDLWLGLDNGIAHVEINTPLTFFSDNSGTLGSTYALSATDKGYLFGTNHGIFTYNNKKLKTIPDSQGQVWDIYKHNDSYIIGHNDGTFVYDGSNLTKANPVNGGWKFLKSTYDDAYFQANYSGIAVYKDISNLSQWKTLDSITKPIRNIAQNKPGELWAADNYRSLYKINYDHDFNVTSVENVSKLNNIHSDYGVKIFKFRNEILFLINNIWYLNNSLTGKLEKNTIFTSAFSDISDILPVDNNRFMVIKEGLLFIISQVQGEFIWQQLPEKYYQGKLIMENTQVYKDGEQLLINLDDGFFSFDASAIGKQSASVHIEAFCMDRLLAQNAKIERNQPINIYVVSSHLGFNKPDLFYRLNGGKELIVVKNGFIALNNLGSGPQELEIFTSSGEKSIKVASYRFIVERPWYFSFWSIVIYVAVISGIFFLYYRWNKVRYNEKVKLNEEELKHRRQILELEMEAEKKLRQQEFEKHKLEAEVQNKASEVAGKSLSIAKHSEMIESIQEVLETESGDEQLKSKIRKIIKTSTISKHEWQSFEKNLIKSHEEFVHRLTVKYPLLTPKDIKLSIYLRMNLSSKEIAPLMNISFRGVELHRYRLRKKLNILQEENLYKFMISI